MKQTETVKRTQFLRIRFYGQTVYKTVCRPCIDKQKNVFEFANFAAKPSLSIRVKNRRTFVDNSTVLWITHIYTVENMSFFADFGGIFDIGGG